MNPYKVLNVEENASIHEIKAAYKQSARKYHPDLGGCHFKMSQVNLAYEQINREIDELNRKLYEIAKKQIVEDQWRNEYSILVSNAATMTSNARAVWITWVLTSKEPPQFIWELHAKNSAYSIEWAYSKYSLQIRYKKNAST